MKAHEEDKALSSCGLILSDEISMSAKEEYANLMVLATHLDMEAVEISPLPLRGRNSLFLSPLWGLTLAR